MATWILTARENVTSPAHFWHYAKAKDLKKGYSLTVEVSSTGGPSRKEVVGALLLAGFCKEEAEWYDNRFDGHEVGEEDPKLYDQQWRAQLNRNDYSCRSEGGSQPEGDKGDASSQNQSAGQRKAGFFTSVFAAVATVAVASVSSKTISKHASIAKPTLGGAGTRERVKVPTPKREIAKRAAAKAEGISISGNSVRRKVTLNSQSNPKLVKPVKSAVPKPSASMKKKIATSGSSMKVGGTKSTHSSSMFSSSSSKSSSSSTKSSVKSSSSSKFKSSSMIKIGGKKHK